MTKNNIVLTLLISLIFSACATYSTRFKAEVEQGIFPTSKEVESTFYLIGDAGDAELGESTVGLELFRSYLKTENTNL